MKRPAPGDTVLKHRHREPALYLSTFALAVVASGGAATVALRKPHPAAPVPLVLQASPATVIGPHPTFFGNASGPYTLVEFMDYQCPPCRANGKMIPGLLSRYNGRVRFTVRNLPLSMHEQARPASLAAEAAREQGKFWPVHDALMAAEPLSQTAISTIVRGQKLDPVRFSRAWKNTAKAAVKADEQAAHSLHIDSTPTFLLCCPDGRVVKLVSLSQMGGLVK